MKRKQRELDMMTVFKAFKSKVLDKKPTLSQMIADVRMMQFKIRPLQGDVTHIDFANTGFVETLWKLGKMDDFIEHHVNKINKKQEQTFFNYFDSMYYRLQDDLNSLNLTGSKGTVRSAAPKNHIEVEIFKMRTPKKLAN
jgi:NCAIR mutase (PurE)-related protein